jgi:hypothetical protein
MGENVMKLSTDTYSNHLNTEYRQRTEAFAHQQRAAQSPRRPSDPLPVSRLRLTLGMLLLISVVFLSSLTAAASDVALKETEKRPELNNSVVVTTFAATARATFQAEGRKRGWTVLTLREELEKGRHRPLISYE